MGKLSKGFRRDEATKVLFKKSTNTLHSHSRTCSGLSQLYSRSAVLQIKKNLQQASSYYKEGDKVKRDLSVETDICVLRGYYRNKRFKSSNYGSSAKSRYSTVIDTEVDTIEEYPDSSACGDSEQAEMKASPARKVGHLMVDNLKMLLQQWFNTHLVDTRKNREAVDIVLNSLLHQLENLSDKSSSRTTFILHREAHDLYVKNKKLATSSIVYPGQRHKTFKLKSESSLSIMRNDSSLSIVFPYNTMKMISTLSIPRSTHKKCHLHKIKKDKNSLSHMKPTDKNVILSLDHRSSSFDILAFSSMGSLVKNCKNCEICTRRNKKKYISASPEKPRKDVSDVHKKGNNHQQNIIEDHDFDDVPSLLKNLYIDDATQLISLYRTSGRRQNPQQDTCTMTDEPKGYCKQRHAIQKERSTNVTHSFRSNQESRHHMFEPQINKPKSRTVAVGSSTDSSECVSLKSNLNDIMESPEPRNACRLATNACTTTNTCRPINMNKSKISKKQRRLNKISPTDKAKHDRNFTFLYKQANKKSYQKSDFLKHCQSVFEHFVDHGNKNVKLDIHFNISPKGEEGKKDVSTVMSKPILSFCDIKRNPALLRDLENAIINASTMRQDSSKSSPTSSFSKNNAELISLLDGAASQTKYLFDMSTAKNTDLIRTANVDRSTITSELQIAQEISELRSVIKDLINAAEKFVSENLKRVPSQLNAETSNSQNTSKNVSSQSKCEAVIDLQNYSHSANEQEKLISDFKINKDQKKDAFEFYTHLAKKSTSYRIIDSESVLKVTDMTSKNHVNKDRMTSHGMGGSSKPKSLIEIKPLEKDKKLLAFFCDGCGNNCYKTEKPQHSCGLCAKQWDCCSKDKSSKDEEKVDMGEDDDRLYLCSSCLPLDHDDNYACPTGYGNDYDGGKQRRRGMGFGEGCIFCLLIWIPVAVIMGMIYVYEIKDRFAPKKDSPPTPKVNLTAFGF